MVINADEKTAKGEFSKDDLISFYKTEINNKPFVEGKDLKRYIVENIKFLEWNTDRVPGKLRRATFPELYEGNKILRGRVTEGTFDNTGIVCNDGVIIFKLFCDLRDVNQRSIDISIKKNNDKIRKELEKISTEFDIKYLLTILNSKFANNFLNNIRRHRLKNYFYPDDFRKLPIPIINKEAQQPFIEKADLMLSLNKDLQTEKGNFLDTLQEEFGTRGCNPLSKITKKLDAFYELEYDAFKKELARQKIKISLGNENNEWRKYFNTTKQKLNELQNQINQTDKEIDQMVYKLYELTPEEIKIVENSTK